MPNLFVNPQLPPAHYTLEFQFFKCTT